MKQLRTATTKLLKSMLVFVALGAAGVAQGEDNYWIGPDGGTFSDAGNWSLGIAPAAGQTLYVTNGPSCVNPFATGTTGINTTLDLGGATQTLTTDIDDVFKSGTVLKNGTFNLSNNATWQTTRHGFTFKVDEGAVLNWAGSIWLLNEANGGSSYFYVQNGGVLNMPKNDWSTLGRYKNNAMYLYVQNHGAFTVQKMRIGWDTGSAGIFHVKNYSSAVVRDQIICHGKSNGSGCGKAEILVQDNSSLSVKNDISWGYQYAATLTLEVSGNSILSTKRICGTSASVLGWPNVTFNDATFVPSTVDVNIFDDTYSSYKAQSKASFHITGGTLTVSNTVGKVTIGGMLDGVGGFRLAGGQDLEFTEAPTYTGATTVEAGTLTYTGASTTGLTVKDGATFAYTNDLNLTAATFEPGAILSMPVTGTDGMATAPVLTVADTVNLDGVTLTPTGVSDWSTVLVKVLTANAVTGTPVVDASLKAYVLPNRADGTTEVWIAAAETALPVTAVYRGNGDTGDYTNAANWTCYNASGTEIESSTPCRISTVEIAGETAFTYPSTIAATFPIKGIKITDSVKLTGDCDWSVFGALALPENATITLNGHTLTAPLTAAQAARVIGSGVITIDVPEDATETIAAAEWGFVKTGAGELKVRLTTDRPAVGGAVTLAEGALTLVNETGTTVENALPTTTTGIAGTLDLGGTTQTFSGNMKDVLGNGATLINGNLNLTSEAGAQFIGGETITFGTNLVMTCAGYLTAYNYGSATYNFKDGCQCTFTSTSDHNFGLYRCSAGYRMNVTSKANVRLAGQLYLGAGIYSYGYLTVDDATFTSSRGIDLGTHKSGTQNGKGELIVRNGGLVDVVSITGPNASGYASGKGTITVTDATIRTRGFSFPYPSGNTMSCAFDNAVLEISGAVDATKGLFYQFSPTVGEGGLTISNAVGNVNYTTAIAGAGGLTLTGAGTNTFAVVPTYAGATTLTNGTTFAYANDQTLSAAAFAPGTTLAMDVEVVDAEAKAAELTVAGDVSVEGVILAPTGLENWNDVEVKILTATNITGTAVVPAGLKTSLVVDEAAGNVELWLMDKNYLPPAMRPVTALYKGDGDTEGYTNAANWVCHNADGAEIEGMVPRYYTTVQLAGETAFTYPAVLADTFPIAGIEIVSNVTLAADCDWQTLGAFPIAADATIALNGHRLDAALTVAQTEKVIGSGVITIDVPEDTTKTIAAADWGFVKTGEGELKVNLTTGHAAITNAVTLAAGALTLVNETDTAVTNALPTTTTGIAGTLDLGGTVQTFTADPTVLFVNGTKVVNGELILTATSKWRTSGTYTFGTNLVMTCAAYLQDPTVETFFHIVDGCRCTFTTKSMQRLGGYRAPKFNLYVTSKAEVRFAGVLGLGNGTRASGEATVDDALLQADGYIALDSRIDEGGDNNGTGVLTVRNGGEVKAAYVVSGGWGRDGGYAKLSVQNATITTRGVYLHRPEGNTMTVTFDNAVFVLSDATPGTVDELFLQLSPTIAAGGLTICNAVGTVNYTTAIAGAGGLTFTGGGTNVFTAAPTYTGATTVTDGTLDLGGLDHGSTVLTVGANGSYAAHAACVDNWTSVVFEAGASVVRTDSETRKDDAVITATKSITGTPNVGARYKVKAEESEGVVKKLTIAYFSGLMFLVR